MYSSSAIAGHSRTLCSTGVSAVSVGSTSTSCPGGGGGSLAMAGVGLGKMTSLLDTCAKTVARTLPFQYIEELYQNRIPEPVQRRIIFYSFPRSTRDVEMYSSFRANSGGGSSGTGVTTVVYSNVVNGINSSSSSAALLSSSNASNNNNSTSGGTSSSKCEGSLTSFQRGFRLYESGCVSNVLQVGFHLSGEISSKKSGDCESGSSSGGSGVVATKYRVHVTFDRCKITGMSCSCGLKDILWCEHVVALSVYRIKNAESVKLRVPISETLLQMDRQQLQKCLQYLISDHIEVLPTAQLLADDILNGTSEINQIDGAPDPTAGGGRDETSTWFLDEDVIIEQIKGYLTQGTNGSSSSYYNNSNKQLIGLFNKVREMLKARDSNGPRLLTLITEQFLNDTRLVQWKVGGITMGDKCRALWEQLGSLWSIICMNPRWTAGDKLNYSQLLSKFNSNSVCPFEDPDFIDEVDDLHLKSKRRRKIQRTIFSRALDSINISWSSLDSIIKGTYKISQFEVDCSRLEALRCHGYTSVALNFSIELVKYLRRIQFDTNYPNFLGQYIDPINILFETLVEPCSNLDGDFYTHASNGRSGESYLKLAFEAALIGLGQTKTIPIGVYAQEKLIRVEEKLINKLQSFENSCSSYDSLVRVLVNYSKELLVNDRYKHNSLPNHTFSRYLFINLLNHDSELAYSLGLKSLNRKITELNRIHILNHLELNQCNLASTMLNSCKENEGMMTTVLDSCILNIKSASHLFKLSQDCFRIGADENNRNTNLIKASFKLCLNTLRITLLTGHRRRWEIVRWIVNVSVEVGLEGVNYLIKHWYELFTPSEAVGMTVGTPNFGSSLTGRGSLIRMNLNYSESEELQMNARLMAVECLRKDPPNCALNALTLCENEPHAFDIAYQIVVDASSHLMNSQQLFTIARYMEHRCYPTRAYKLATLAMELVHIGYNQDTHPAIADVHWACGLSHSLGRSELAGMIPILIKNVKCATVLSEILRRSNIDKRRCKESFKLLIEASISAFIATTHTRLAHISPRHYTDFIEFLSKAKETFLLSTDGNTKFNNLIENARNTYKGKKKLMFLVKERFG